MAHHDLDVNCDGCDPPKTLLTIRNARNPPGDLRVSCGGCGKTYSVENGDVQEVEA